MLQEQLLGAYSIEINQAAVLLSLDNRRQYEKPNEMDNNDPLEINLTLLSFFPLWKAILTIKEALLNEIKGPQIKSIKGWKVAKSS